MSPDRKEVRNSNIVGTKMEPQIKPPRDSRGRIRYPILTPEDRVIVIRQEAQAVLSANRALRQQDTPGLLVAVRKYYPGGLSTLRLDLKQPVVKRANGYWTPEIIEAAAEQFIDQNRNLSAKVLIEAHRADLAVAATRKYPGGIKALKEKLGLPIYRSEGYWQDPGNIESEARRFLEAGGVLTQKGLNKGGLSSLIFAARHYYPGGLRNLQINLQLNPHSKPRGYWTPETIEQEALEFYQANGVLTQKMLTQRHRQDLSSAISEDYTGGIGALKTKLGIELSKKPNGYWTEKQIETEVLAFYEAEGMLTQRALIGRKRFGLNVAITRRYPGGMKALKEKMGIGVSVEDLIPPDEANKQLRRLLEVENG